MVQWLAWLRCGVAVLSDQNPIGAGERHAISEIIGAGNICQRQGQRGGGRGQRAHIIANDDRIAATIGDLRGRNSVAGIGRVRNIHAIKPPLVENGGCSRGSGTECDGSANGHIRADRPYTQDRQRADAEGVGELGAIIERVGGRCGDELGEVRCDGKMHGE